MDELFVASLYKSNDERIEIDLEPLVYDEWLSDAATNPQLLSIIQRASQLLNGTPVTAKTRKPFDEANNVMDIHLDDGRSAFVRILAYLADESPTEMWKRARLFAELSILRWLESNASGLPVPRVLVFDDDKHLLITTFMPGLDANHAYPRLSPSAKERSVASWAPISVLMFRLPAPQRFGMVGESLVQVASYLSVSPEHTFDTDKTVDLLSFFTSAISSRRARSLVVNNVEEHEILCRRLDRLLEGLNPLIALAQQTPYMSRFAVTHNDLRPDNIILEETSGDVTGIVDWEHNSCMPACMSAGYPSWIRSPIVESPMYSNPKSKMVYFFHEPRGERNRLCDLYEKTVKELDDEYYNCLIHGTRLRDALAWIEISDSDDDGFAMARWTEEHLFQNGVGTDHRCA
ncbi:hypothetical protein DFH07DRAFT_278594 [Mycena maculata]|uniref:Aminoglycoside phosphotransferase domain-containing protein n=1 Tax=Mycena maculata TaxID=230809 RepID=A0AAD7HMS6_9AGAR|nr:hypothetical protein DFH07DRAFT_278594 [Mycena maculata]